MKRFSGFRFAGLAALAIATAILFTYRAPRMEAAETPDSTAGDHSGLAKAMVGAWAISGRVDGQELPEGVRQVKFFGDKSWSISISEEKTGKVLFHHGGTYTLKGDEYTEKIEYANDSTAEMIGQSFKFKIKIEGDTFTQVGVGNPYSEIYKRIK